jgi:hypothetical protein
MKGLGFFLFSLMPALCPTAALGAFSPNQAGVSGAQFLELGAGGRALGMGEAMASVPDGLNSLYWNPAGLASLAERRVSLTHTQIFSDFNYDSFGYGQPLSTLKGALAASFSLLSQSGIQAVTNTAQPLPGTFNPYSAALSLGYGRALGAWQAGLALKGIKENLYDVNAYAAALDAGVTRYLNERASLGFAVRNWGTKERFAEQSFSLPFELDLGASYRWRGLILASDLALPYYGRTNGKFGMEYRMAVDPRVAYTLRLGYKTLTVSDVNALSGLTAGVGFELGRGTFDFGFQPMQNLGQIFRFSLGFRF